MLLAVIAFSCTYKVEGEVCVGEEIHNAIKVLGGIGTGAGVEIYNYFQLGKAFYWSACDKSNDI